MLLDLRSLLEPVAAPVVGHSPRRRRYRRTYRGDGLGWLPALDASGLARLAFRGRCIVEVPAVGTEATGRATLAFRGRGAAELPTIGTERLRAQLEEEELLLLLLLDAF